MDTNDFFDKFVVNHPLYNVDKSFMVLTDNFRNVFLNETYEILPKLFKDLYEKGEIPSEVYDQVLIDCGVSYELLNEFTLSEKKIFLNTLTDFQKYKATVGLTESVIKAYGNNFEAYELYVDYNTSRCRWECKPYPIYKPIYNDGFTRTISYRTVYERIPNLLIHENQLDLMRQQNLAAFPLKTNIVFVASNYNQSVTNYIQNMIISVFYKTYYDTMIDINFQDATFNISLYTFLLIWLYLVFNKNPSTVIEISGNVINFSITPDDHMEISIDDLDDILEEYEQLGTNTLSKIFSEDTIETDFDNFYYKYIHPLKSELSSGNDVLDKDQLVVLIKAIDPILLDYLDEKIEGDIISTIALLMGDLVKSIEDYKSTTTDVNFVKYFKYFKTFLPTIDFLPEQNTVYKILYYVKPFHTEFLDLNDLSIIYSNDEFNNLYFKIFCRQGLLFTHSDHASPEEFYYHNYLEKGFSDIAPISAKMGGWVKNPYQKDSFSLADNFIDGSFDIYEGDINLTDNFTLLFSPD
jgi:hypothetical protein